MQSGLGPSNSKPVLKSSTLLMLYKQYLSKLVSLSWKEIFLHQVDDNY